MVCVLRTVQFLRRSVWFVLSHVASWRSDLDRIDLHESSMRPICRGPQNFELPTAARVQPANVPFVWRSSQMEAYPHRLFLRQLV